MVRTRLIVFLAALWFLPVAGYSADYPPGLMYSTVLNGVQLLRDTGQFRMDNVQAVFLPDPQSSAYYPYNPDDGGKVWTILSTAAGEELWRFDWYGELLKSPYWLLSSYKASNLKSGETSSGWVDLKQPGNYVLDFYLDSGRFYTFPFSVDMLSGDDPFDGDPYYFINGDWSDWGYFYYRDADPAQSIAFKLWLNNHAHSPYRDVKPELKVMRGGTVICTSRPNWTLSLQAQWNRFEFDLIFPMEGTSGGAYFKAQDLLNTDGSYTMVLNLDGEKYGTWEFTVKDGKFQPAGRTVRSTADPLTFVEGGKDAFWYKKQ